MPYYSDEELAELRESMRSELAQEQAASQRTQSSLVQFLKMVGLSLLARQVAAMSLSVWHRFRRMIGWA